MGGEVECSRCGETFESQEALMVHSVDVHAGDATETDTGGRTDPAGEVDRVTAERLLEVVEEQAAERGGILVEYGEGFLLAAAAVALVVVAVLTGLFVTGVIGVAVYMFSLGTLFGLTVSYLQGFVQSVRR